MAKLEDYGIRIINHGEWSDPEVEWKKSKHQTLLFNYWDCIECFESEDFDLTKEEDISTLEDSLYNLTPSEYAYPEDCYVWSVWTDSGDGFYDETLFDDSDYFKDRKLSAKEDFVLHTAGMALRQALTYVFEDEIKNCEITVKHWNGKNYERVAHYLVQGSTLRNVMNYSK